MDLLKLRLENLRLVKNVVMAEHHENQQDTQSYLIHLRGLYFTYYYRFYACPIFRIILITIHSQMSAAVRTRHGNRANRFNSRRKVDANQRKAVTQDKLMYL